MTPFNETAVITTLITAIGGVVGTYIVYKSKRIRPESKKQVDKAIDSYESLVKSLDRELRRKDDLLSGQEKMLTDQRVEITTLRNIINNKRD